MTAAVFSQKTLRIIAAGLLIAAAFLPRLLFLGTSLTIDEPLWIHRGEAFVNRMATFNATEAIPSIQPGVTTSWIVGLVSSWHSLAVSQASIGVASAILVLLCSYFLITLLGYRWGFLASFILALDPFLVAHGRVTHTDSLLALSMLASLLAVLVYGEYLLDKEEKPLRYLIAAAIFLALGILTKIFALALIVPIAIIVLFYHWRAKTLKTYVPRVLVFAIALVLAVLAIWPTLVVNFTGVYNQLTGGISNYAEGTRNGEVTAQWWYYLREIYFRATPITTIFLLPSLVCIFFGTKKERRIWIALVLATLFYVFVLSVRGEKSDRYVLLTMVTLAMFAVVGIKFLLRWLASEWPNLKQQLFGALSGVVLIILTTLFLHAFPYPLAYYNPLYPIEPHHKLGWGEGLDVAAKWLSKNHPDSPVATYYPRVFSYFYTGNSTVDSLEHTSDNETSYLVLYRSMFERGIDTPETDLLNQYVFSGTKKPVHMIEINGLPYVWIFEHPAT